MRHHTLSGRIAVPLWAALWMLGAQCDRNVARADDVWTNSAGRGLVKYGSVKIQGDQDGMLVFKTERGNLLYKPIGLVIRIYMHGRADLNQAEDLFADGDPASAVELYESVAVKAKDEWLKRLAIARLIVCYGAGDRFGDSVRAWIATLKVWPSHAVTCRPGKPAAKGSRANRQAMLALAAVEKDSKLPPAARRAVGKLRSSIRRVEGVPAGASGQGPNPTTLSGDRVGGRSPGSTGPIGQADFVACLDSVARLADKGRHALAVSRINAALARVPQARRKAYMPRLLTLKAQCLTARADVLAEGQERDAEGQKRGAEGQKRDADGQERGAEGQKRGAARQQYLYGGLAAMHVVTFFPESPRSVECLYVTGKCHEKLGRTELAVSLYRECRTAAAARKQPKLEQLAVRALKRLARPNTGTQSSQVAK